MRIVLLLLFALCLVQCRRKAKLGSDTQEIGKYAPPGHYNCKELKVVERSILKMRDDALAEAAQLPDCRPAVSCAFSQGLEGVGPASELKAGVADCDVPSMAAFKALADAQPAVSPCFELANLGQRLGYDYARLKVPLYQNYNNNGRGCDFAEWSNPAIPVVDMPTCGSRSGTCENMAGNNCYVCSVPTKHNESATLCRTKVEARNAAELWCDLTYFDGNDTVVPPSPGNPGSLVKKVTPERKQCTESIACRPVQPLTPSVGSNATGAGTSDSLTDSFYTEGEVKAELKGGIALGAIITVGGGFSDRITARLQGNRKADLSTKRFGGPLWVMSTIGEGGASMETSSPRVDAACSFEITNGRVISTTHWGEAGLSLGPIQGSVKLSVDAGGIRSESVTVGFEPMTGGGKTRAGLEDMCRKANGISFRPAMREALSTVTYRLRAGAPTDTMRDGVIVERLNVSCSYKSFTRGYLATRRIFWKLNVAESSLQNSIDFTYEKEGIFRGTAIQKNPRVTNFPYGQQIGGYDFARAWIILAGYDGSGWQYFSHHRNLIVAMMERHAQIEKAKQGLGEYPDSWEPHACTYTSTEPCPDVPDSCPTTTDPQVSQEGERITL